MKLSTFLEKPISEAVKDLNLVDTKIHTDEEGNVCAIEMKYRPQPEPVPTSGSKPRGW